MKHSRFLAGLVAGGALAIAGFAQAAGAAMTAQMDMAKAQQVREQMQAQVAGSKSAAAKAGVAGAKPGGPTASELYANPNRAYPPSCLSSPIPFGLWQNDPFAVHYQITLLGDPLTNDAGELAYTEPVDVYVFRVACTSGQSATLLEIDRPSSMDGNSSRYPTLPAVYVTQNGVQDYVTRTANDPNTFFSTNYALNPLINSDVFVLENYYGGSVQFNFNNAVTVTVDNLSVSARQIIDTPLATYNPAQYAAASQPLPISGYMTGNWYDKTHSGEGIQVEVGELQASGSTFPRYITIAWYTYDSAGIPYWLFGTGFFNAGEKSATVNLAYQNGGSFAGSGSSATSPVLWGTFNVQFTDCNTMKFNYQSASGLPTGVPTGSGSKTWTRLTQMNGLTCQ